MSNDKKNTDWISGWMDVQKQYWDNVSSMMQSFSSSEPIKNTTESLTFGFFKNFSSMPAIGPSRENIEMLQQCQPLLSDFNEALGEYHPVLADLCLKAWKLTATKVADAIKQGQTLTARQLYDLWIECGEQTHAEVVTTENYQKIYGKFANASMACKKHNQAILQEALSSMDLPTKQELNSAYERIQILMREIRNSKRDMMDLKRQMHEFFAKKSEKLPVSGASRE